MKSNNPVTAHDSWENSRFDGAPRRNSGLRDFLRVRFFSGDDSTGMLGTPNPHQLTPWLFSKRKDAEEQIQESKSMIQAVFDGIPDPLILLDRDFPITKLLNRAAAKYYGVHEPGEVIYRRALLRGIEKTNRALRKVSLSIGDFERPWWNIRTKRLDGPR